MEMPMLEEFGAMKNRPLPELPSEEEDEDRRIYQPRVSRAIKEEYK